MEGAWRGAGGPAIKETIGAIDIPLANSCSVASADAAAVLGCAAC